MSDAALGLLEAVRTSLIDKSQESQENLRPKLVYNNTKIGNTVLSVIEGQLLNCDSFWFSVAFITKGGIVVLKETLKELIKKDIKGKILTTDYLAFNEPDALRELLGYKNMEVKVFTEEQFHTKGYMFYKNDMRSFIIGSSNMTQTALKANKEWNLEITSTNHGELISECEDEFNSMWANAIPLTEEWITEYYEPIYKKQRKKLKQEKIERISTYILQPNSMQKAAIQSLSKLRNNHIKKALLISATGTGKTYLSAFDVRNFKPRKLLFLVHREQILKQAIESFKDVLGNNINAGLLSGTSKDFESDYLFSTIQTISKDENLAKFGKDYFDYIIIDETHKAGAKSYLKILNYFNPNFLLGMTATPERSDDFDIFKLFDYNIAYEIRLQQAMEENLLCPFHYFGVSDLIINDVSVDDKTEFTYLTSETRVQNIISNAKYYGHSGDRVKGLIFCSRNDEAKELSILFNEKGYKTVALSGENTQQERENAIRRLEQEQLDNRLDYIFTVDIFNEGVDIPAINQIIMLRPTQSSIIFVQQLGRGLRKNQDKEYVVIIDFIGNYEKNYLIPIALSGDKTYNKDSIRRYVAGGNRIIPGCSTIHFDEITKKRIYSAIDNANFSEIRLIKDNYKNLKNKLGRIPSMIDFDQYGEMDILRIIDNKSLGSYYKYLVKYEKDYTIRLSAIADEMVEYISKKFLSGKRIHEILILKYLLEKKTNIFSYLKMELSSKYGISLSENTIINLINILTNNFITGSGKDIYKNCIFIKKDINNDYSISEEFQKELEDSNFYKILIEIIDFSFARYEKSFSKRYNNTSLVLYQKYTYDDVCRLLDWDKSEVALNIGGYKNDEKTKTYPVYINYDKSEDIRDSIKYEDVLVDPATLIAFSKPGRTIKSNDMKIALHSREYGYTMHLFVRKNKNDGNSKEFYYLGEIVSTGEKDAQEVIMPNTNNKVVRLQYRLLTPIRNDLYEYLIS